MKKKKKQFEKWANVKLLELRKIMLLEHFDLKAVQPCEKDEASYCKFDHPYQTIRIFYAKRVYEDWEKGDKLSALGTLAHEMCHPLTDDLYSKSFDRFCGKKELEDSRERLTDHISNIILKHNLIKP